MKVSWRGVRTSVESARDMGELLGMEGNSTQCGCSRSFETGSLQSLPQRPCDNHRQYPRNPEEMSGFGRLVSPLKDSLKSTGRLQKGPARPQNQPRPSWGGSPAANGGAQTTCQLTSRWS